MKQHGLVVVVTASSVVKQTFLSTLEPEGWVVLSLRDSGELFDFIEILAARPGPGAPLRAVVTDASVPVSSALEVAAWARLRGFEVPFVVFSDDADQNATTVAAALRAVKVVVGATPGRARRVLHDVLSA